MNKFQEFCASTKAFVTAHVWAIVIVLWVATLVAVWWYKWGQFSVSSTPVAAESSPKTIPLEEAFDATPGSTNVVRIGTSIVTITTSSNGGAHATILNELRQPEWQEGPYDGVLIPTQRIGNRVGVHPSETPNEAQPPVGVILPMSDIYQWEQVTMETKALLGVHEGAYDIAPGYIWIARPKTPPQNKPKMPTRKGTSQK